MVCASTILKLHRKPPRLFERNLQDAVEYSCMHYLNLRLREHTSVSNGVIYDNMPSSVTIA